MSESNLHCIGAIRLNLLLPFIPFFFFFLRKKIKKKKKKPNRKRKKKKRTQKNPKTFPTNPLHQQAVFKPQTVTASADAVYLPMADLTDGHAMNVDFHSMANRVASNLRRMKLPVEQQAGMMKQLWSDMIDDLFSVGGAAAGKTTGTVAARA